MVSLVVATIGRTEKFRRLLESLAEQTSNNFEVIVVDQNEDKRLIPTVEEFEKYLEIKYLKSDPGLSRARNAGINLAEGELIGFPDDDCWYSPDVVSRLEEGSTKTDKRTGFVGQWNLIASKRKQKNRKDSCSELNRYRVTTKVMSPTLFLPVRRVREIGGFDESLGLGPQTEWKAGEDIDIALRYLDRGGTLLYDSELIIHHPDHRGETSGSKKGYLYGAAMGHVLNKHDFPGWFAYYHFLRSFFGSLFYLLSGNLNKARYYWATFSGKKTGWREGE